MKTGDFLKKYGFVAIVGLALLIFIGLYIGDSVKNRQSAIATKQVDGQYVVYSVDEHNFTADELYDTLYKGAGTYSGSNALRHAIVDSAVKTTSEMETGAANYAAYMLQYYGEDQILEYVRQEGYSTLDDLQKLYIFSMKESVFQGNYYTAHADEYVQGAIDAYQPKKLYHILVKVADVTESTDADGNTVHTANPTEEESAKLQSVLDALKTSSFQDVAKQYSEDTSAADGGYLGIVGTHNTSTFVKEFADEAAVIKEGETSEVITTTYGYHILYAEKAETADLLADSTFLNSMNTLYPNAYYKALLEAVESQGIVISDENLLKALQDSAAESEEN